MAMTTTQCKRCGELVRVDAKVCSGCGVKNPAFGTFEYIFSILLALIVLVVLLS